jgi:class 3 adenylate cyclase
VVRKTLSQPDDVRRFPHGAGALVRVGAFDVGRAVLEPGWRWSVDVKPMVETASCETHHLHVVLAGRFAARMDSGEQYEFGPDDVVDLPPGHDTWVVGDEPVVLLDISGNVSDFAVPTPHARSVLTMLMTDIVDSTHIASRLGDAGWKRVLTEHDRAVRRQLDRFRGRETKTTGDGFLATFESAAAAVLCGMGIIDAAREVGVELRIGVHTGEVEVLAGDIRGLAVHATARVMAAAGPGEVLVSSLTRAIAAGSAVGFESRGHHELKGLEGTLELFRVSRDTEAPEPP